MREHIFNQRKQQEDLVMQKRPKTAGVGQKKNLKKGERIEDRLIEQKKKYDERAEQLKRDRLMEEMSEVREVPQINAGYRNNNMYS